MKRRSLLQAALLASVAGAVRERIAQAAPPSLDWYVGRILFRSDRAGEEAIYAVLPDGTQLTRVDDPSVGFHYAEAMQRDLTSADGNFRLFVKDQGLATQIWQQDLRTGTSRILTGDDGAINYDPVWAPDNRYIAYVSQVEGNDEIYLYDRQELSRTRLTSNVWEWDKAPSFSPDGRQIAFWSNRSAQFRHVWVMNADGTAPRNITGWGNYNDWDPVWVKAIPTGVIPEPVAIELVKLERSPGCIPAMSDYVGKILFKSDADGEPAVFLLDPANGSACRVDDPNVGFYYAEALAQDTISPDGRYRLFVKESGPGTQIWQEDVHSHETAMLINTDVGFNYEPTWSPADGLMAYTYQAATFQPGSSGRNEYRSTGTDVIMVRRPNVDPVQVSSTRRPRSKHPSFSRDGQSIVYYAFEDEGWKQLRLVQADGSRERSAGHDGNWNDWDPVWVKAEPSPPPEFTLDDVALPTLPTVAPVRLEPLPRDWYVNRILFLSDREGTETFFAVKPDGTELTRVDDPYVGYYYFEGKQRNASSADGRYRLFVNQVDGDIQIWQEDTVTGAISYVVGGGAGTDYDPSWAPDTRYVAYVTDRDGNDEIHLYDRTQQADYRLTSNTWEWDKHPSFSPDGTRIAFHSNREARFRHIWIMEADGSNPVNVSGWLSFNDWDPVWIRTLPSAAPDAGA